MTEATFEFPTPPGLSSIGRHVLACISDALSVKRGGYDRALRETS